MAEIKRLLFWRHLRSEPSAHVLHFRGGRPVRDGRGLAFWFLPLSASVAEIPCDDQELPFLFHGRSRDFQDVTVQGAITFRVVKPVILAERLDFTLDLDTGNYRKTPLEQLSQMLTKLAQQFALNYLAHTPVGEVLAEGVEVVRTRVREGLTHDKGLEGMGLEIVALRVSQIAPTSELEKALQTPTRESIQQRADEATFQRRALAVEKERAIQENELQNQIELARQEETLIAQSGQNEQRRAREQSEAQRIAAEAQAEQARIEAAAKAEGIRAVETARVESERERMDIYRELPAAVIVGLAARELASKLKRIDHLNVSPDLFGPMLTNLIEAGTQHLSGNGKQQ